MSGKGQGGGRGGQVEKKYSLRGGEAAVFIPFIRTPTLIPPVPDLFSPLGIAVVMVIFMTTLVMVLYTLMLCMVSLVLPSNQTAPSPPPLPEPPSCA